MLTAPFKAIKQEALTYEVLPEEIYPVELLDIGTKEFKNNFKKTEKDPDTITHLVFQFTILNEEHRCRNVWDNFIPMTLYISPKKGKNRLYQVLEALLGHELSPAEENGIDDQFLNGLVGKHCRLFIGINAKNSKYNEITKFMPKKESFPALTEEEKEKARVKEKEDKAVLAEREKKFAPHEDSGEMSEEERLRYEATFGPDPK